MIKKMHGFVFNIYKQRYKLFNKSHHKLNILMVLIEQLNDTIQLIHNLEATQSKYLHEKGESQDATKLKDKAFVEIDEWMSEFYEVAKDRVKRKPTTFRILGQVCKKLRVYNKPKTQKKLLQ
jgi:hypothetical protein